MSKALTSSSQPIRASAKVLGVRFTLFAVVVLIALMAMHRCIAMPMRSREAVLNNNLGTMRAAIALYQKDLGRYPARLEDLVTEGYLRNVPMDPITMDRTTWTLTFREKSLGLGIMDVRSGASGSGLDGTAYDSW